MYNPLDATRRSIVTALLGSMPASSAMTSTTLAPPSARDTPSGIASVRDFGAVGDGVADDSDAFRRAVAATRYLFVPPGRYRLGTTVKLASGQRVFGTGKSAWEPYNETSFPQLARSEILVDKILAFDATGTNSTTLEGMAIKARRGQQSRWGTPAGSQQGATGIDITGSSQFEARDLSFHGLDVAIDANQRAGSPDTQMPSISDWSATDCRCVFRFGNAASKVYTVRDARIGEAIVTIHCDNVVEAHRCDGLRLENLRLFHGNGTSIYIRETAFVTLSAVTVFETGGDQVVLENCSYLSAAGLLLARAGAYRGEGPYPQRVGLTLRRCHDAQINVQVQQPTGMAVMIADAANIDLACAIGTPFWMTGNQNHLSGAVTITLSTAVNLQASFGGEGRDYWASVWADAHSSQTLSGSVASDRSIGVIRATHLQQQGGHIFHLPNTVTLAPHQAQRFKTLRMFIPAGKIAKARSIQTSFFPLELATAPVNAKRMVVCTAQADMLGDDGERITVGTITDRDYTLYDNSRGSAGWYAIELGVSNPAAQAITVPADTIIAVSTILV